jgi:threonine-phosphate decarboxylase
MEKAMHGGDIYSPGRAGALDFSANINPLGPPESVKAAAAGADFSKYPDPQCRALRAALSHYEGVPSQWIFCSNGASEIFFRIALALRPREALITAPAFSEYRRAAECAGANVRVCRLTQEHGFLPGADFLDMIVPGVGLVFLCSPNNPTGLTPEREYIRLAAERCRSAGAVLVCDECFMDFAEGWQALTSKPLLAEFGNLITVGAFTKIFAMPGARLGWCECSDPAIIEKISLCGQAWSVSSFAQAAGAAACGEKAYAARTREYIAHERAFLLAELRRLGGEPVASKANFILFRARGDSRLAEKMLTHGVLIRSCANFEGLGADWYRVAVRTREENLRLIGALTLSLPEK